MTLVGRRELDHPALGITGGAGLHTSIETIYTNVGDDLTGRFKAYSGVANSAVTNIKHNFGVAFEELDIVVYTGTFPNLTVATDYTVAVDGGNPKTHINVTAPGSGGPHTFAVQINHSSQTLKNKVLQTANVDQYLDFDEESAPATPSANKVRMYAKADGKFYKKDDTGLEQVIGGGSGAGGINYLVSSSKAWDFEDGLSTGWSAYADAAAVSPVDGTGGTPNVTFAASASSPLRGLYSGLLTKDAANRQGQGVSVDFTLDSQDTGKPFTLNVDCSASAAYTGPSGTEYARVYVYDVTNAALLPGYIDIAPGSSTCKGFFLATTSTSYRLIFHVAGTGTSAWTLKVDNVTPGQQSLGFGSTTTDSQLYTATMTGFGTVSTQSFYQRRVGSKLQVRGYFLAGTLTNVQAKLSIPTGISINTAQYTQGNNKIGFAIANAATAQTVGSNGILFAVLVDTTDASTVSFAYQTDTIANAKALSPQNASLQFNSNSYITVDFEVEIAQWSSNMIAGDRAVEEFASNSGMGDADDTTSFVNGASGSLLPGVTYSTLRTKTIRFQTPIQPNDTLILEIQYLGKWTPWSGNEISGAAAIGPWQRQGGSGSTYGATLFRADTVTTDAIVAFGRYAINSSGTYGGAGDNWAAASGTMRWRVRKISGGALVGYPIGVSNVVGTPSFRAFYGASHTLTSGADTDMQANTETFDVTSAYDTTTYRFTPQVGGKYLVGIKFRGTTSSANSMTQIQANIIKNGSLTTRHFLNMASGVTTQSITVQDVVSMNGTTDYIKGSISLTGGGTLSVETGSDQTYIYAYRIGD